MGTSKIISGPQKLILHEFPIVIKNKHTGLVLLCLDDTGGVCLYSEDQSNLGKFVLAKDVTASPEYEILDEITITFKS